MAIEKQTLTFAHLLKRYRAAAGLTQEELAQRAGLSPHGVSDLERGARRLPRRDTVALLADALALSERERALLEAAARTRAPAASALPAPASGGAALRLVGRSAEVRQIERHLSGDGPPLLLLAGEPGIGKSRLLQEAGARAPAEGWTVLTGGCHRRSGQEPFAPFPDLLARYAERLAPRERTAALSGCAWLARLVPKLVESLPAPGYAQGLPPEQERRLAFAAVARYLANVAGPAGALLVLDDLQWAGQDALDLLAYLVRAASARPLRCVAAYRDTDVRAQDALPALVADLAREGLASRVLVDPLDAADAASLLDELLPRMASDAAADAADTTDLRRRVLDRTGGVPFFLVSCAQALATGALDPGAGRAAGGDIPWSVAETIRQRIAALPGSARTLLEIAAVAGRSSPASMLVIVATRAGLSDAEAVGALEAAVRARLLEEQPGPAYAFAHDLVREVAGGGVSAGRAALFHRQIAETLELRPGGAPAADLAYHYARSDDREKAVAYLERAGDQARERFANAEAAGYYRELAERLEALHRPLAAAGVRERLAAVLAILGRYEDAQAALEPAADAYRAEHDREGQMRALAQASYLYARRGLPAEGLARLAPILPSAERMAPSPAQAALYAALSWLYYSAKRYADQFAAVERGVEIARATGDERAVMEVELRLAVALWTVGRLDDAEHVLANRVLPIAEARGDVGTQWRAINDLAMTFNARGEYAKERSAVERTVELAERTGDAADIALATAHLGDSAFVTGDWRAARELQQRALALTRRVDAWMWAAMPETALGVLAFAQGDWDAGRRYLAEVRRYGERGAESVFWLESVLAERDLLEGRAPEALARLKGLLDEPHRSNTSFYELRALLGCILARAGEAARGAALADEVIAQARAQGMRPALADALRYRAWIAVERDQPDAAAEALDMSLALARPMPRPYSEAKALYVYGLLHARRGERDAARERLQQALAILHRLGERLYAEHVERTLAAVAI